jgi:esterase/lipase superfamily enzyme
MMAEPMMAQPQQFDAAEYEPAVAAPMAAAPPEPTPAAAPAPTPAAAPAAAAPSNPFGALARLAPAETSEAFVPDMESRGNAADALPPDVASAATAPQPASASPQSIAELASEKTPPPPAEDLTSIMVHYATNRQRLTAEDRQFSVYFQGFFFSLPAVVLYALILLALVVFPMLGRRAWAAAAVVTGIALLVSMASIEAYVRSQLRDELSGELYGSVPTNLNYGKCKISVPKPENRVAGELNRPLSVWVLQAPENPEKHFTLQQVTEHADKDEFYNSLSQQLANSEDGTSLLFIHGYNVSFEDALFRTAQLAVDLKFHGAPISFSWPSYADPVKYTFDEQNAEVSIPALREFLEDLATRSGAKRIHIVAHSMGNRVLAGALRAMSPDARQRNKAMFREIVLAAPDIDSRVFQSQVLPHIQENTEHCTLYASSNDRALMLSRYFHNYQRLGETEPELIVATGMDTIDASLVDTSLLGHSYIGDVQSIVSDLHELVVVGKRPTERIWLEAELLGELMYWAIRPDVQTASEQKTNR